MSYSDLNVLRSENCLSIFEGGQSCGGFGRMCKSKDPFYLNGTIKVKDLPLIIKVAKSGFCHFVQ